MNKLFIALLMSLVLPNPVSAVVLPSVNLLPDQSTVLVGDTINVLVQVEGMPETDGPSLGLDFDPTILSFTGVTTVSGSPFTDVGYSDTDLLSTQIDFVFALVPLFGSAASGDFDAFSLIFEAIGSGNSMITLSEDGLFTSWPATVTAESIAGVSYNNTHVTVQPSAVPLPGAAWFFASGLVGMISISRLKKLKKS